MFKMVALISLLVTVHAQAVEIPKEGYIATDGAEVYAVGNGTIDGVHLKVFFGTVKGVSLNDRTDIVELNDYDLKAGKSIDGRKVFKFDDLAAATPEVCNDQGFCVGDGAIIRNKNLGIDGTLKAIFLNGDLAVEMSDSNGIAMTGRWKAAEWVTINEDAE